MADAEPHIPFVTSGSYPVRQGNTVRPLIDGAPAFRRICAAIAAARHSAWGTVAYLASDFRMPDDWGSLFDVLDRAAARGLDIRVIFWRPNPESNFASTFSGSAEEHDMLRTRGSRFRIRWDVAPFCHHQKSWLIDAEHPSETAFVGGINLTHGASGAPGHTAPGFHDAYVEVAGPSATDVHHNFVQRWNEASERMVEDGTWGHDGDDDLVFPTSVSAARGTTPVQIQRTIHAGLYRDGRPSPGAATFDIAGGERSVLDQYLQAIGAARGSIYIENQAVEVAEIVTALDTALTRGVDVVALVPGEPEERVRALRRTPESRVFYDRLAALGRHASFSLVGIAGLRSDGKRHDVYVHGKVMLIDDAWATIGSCNLHGGSLFRQSELNASFWDPKVVRALRCELLAEHLDQDTADLDDRAALSLYRWVAQENRRKRDSGDAGWQGLAFTLDPATYGA